MASSRLEVWIELKRNAEMICIAKANTAPHKAAAAP